MSRSERASSASGGGGVSASPSIAMVKTASAAIVAFGQPSPSEIGVISTVIGGAGQDHRDGPGRSATGEAGGGERRRDGQQQCGEHVGAVDRAAGRVGERRGRAVARSG